MKKTYNYNSGYGSKWRCCREAFVLAFCLLILGTGNAFAQNGDTCATAINLATLTSPYSGTTAGFANNNTPTCNTGGTAADVFYYIAVPNGYTLTIGQTASNYDSIRSIFYGSCDSQTPIGCVDFPEIGTTTWENTTGSTQNLYYVQDGWNANQGTYTLAWSLVAPPACNVPRTLAAALTSATAANISWAVPATGAVESYEYALTTLATPPTSGTRTIVTSVNAVPVTVNTTNYLHVRTNCGTTDGYSEWATYSFYSGICIPTPLSVDGSGITNVTLGTIDNTTGAEPNRYNFFEDQTVNIGQGVTLPISVTLTTNSAYNIKVWVDWNDNLTFDANEEVFAATTAATRTATATGTITVPADAILGNHRMRVGAVATWNPIVPCFNNYGGSFEDYTINVTAAPTCFIPVAPTAVNAGAGIANVSWTAPAQGTAPSGYEYAITATRTTPASGTAVTETSVEGVTVPTNTTFYLQVRSNCGNGDYSEWIAAPFYNGVCIPAPTSVNGSGIVNVTIGSINNTTVAEPGNYSNYSAQIANIGQGVTQPFSISLTTYTVYNTKIWVDWNNDLDFDDEGEEIYSGASNTLNVSVLTGSFTVPLNTPVGQYRLRVGATSTYNGPTTACYTGANGTYEDYTLNITPAPTCFAPTAVTGQSVNLGTANITWTAPEFGTTPSGYEYAVTSTATPPASGTANTTTTATNVAVTANAVNYLHVRTNCGNGDFSAWTTATFFNGYCTPAPTFQGGSGITNVTLGSINNTTSGATAYENYTDQVATIGQGVTQPLSISLFVYDAYSTKVWVDWNNDLDFDDEGEEVYSIVSPATTRATVTGTITVPLTAAVGNHRMRVGSVPNSVGNATPCYFIGMGSFEDYTINVAPAPSCYAPTNLAGTSTSAGIISLSFTAPSLGGTPAGYEYAVTTTEEAPESGTATTSTSLTGVAVTPNTVNYIHVRTNCGNGDFSEWAVISVYNGICIPTTNYGDGQGITNVTIGSINNTTVAETNQYGDYSAQIVNIGQGVSQPFSISLFTYNAYNIKIWVDWNDNLVFDANEEVYSGVSPNTQTGVLTGTFLVPATAPLGQHRLRIGGAPSYNALPTPCSTIYTGAFEDYTVNVTLPPSCSTPTAPAGVVVAASTANLSWTAPQLGTPQGYEYAVTTEQNPPASGTPVTSTFVNGYTGLENNVYYTLFVRTNCGEGDYSEWIASARFRYLEGDTCATAIDLATQTSPYSSTTVGAGNDYMPACATNSSAPDLFYKIEVPNGYTLDINQTQNAYDSYQSIFYGSCEENTRVSLVCTDNNIGGVIWENLTGSTQTVYFVQDGWGTNSGAFTLEWTLIAPASCDLPRNLDVFQTSLTTANVSWTAPNTGLPAGYEYAVTTSQTAPESGTYTTAFTATGVALTANTDSYLHVRSACGDDEFSEWVTYAFYSGYCVPVSNSAGNYISGITTTGAQVNFSNTGTGGGSYTDYTNEFYVTTYAGGSFAITATHSTGEYLYSVWIDWNNNFDFSDAGERVASLPFLASPANLGNIAVPLGTPEGTYRMRIRNALTGSPIPVCDAVSGEAEDYTLIVGPAPTCFPPFAPSIEPVDATSANLRWSPPILGDFPQGYEYVLSTSATAPTGSGTPTTAIFIEAAPYNPAVSAYLFVRSVCGEGEYSDWESTAILDTDVPQLDKNSVLVYKDGNTINIATGTTLMTGVTIYDVRGSKIYTQNNINATEAAIAGLQVQQQVIIVEINTAKGKISKKIVF
ncbi:T9SS sorting signal type C domain-containing protein [Flavobacterium sp. Sd200]|uniref:GEVED domain-containing protein n=1 Tax=Flavobacterium sp. Sd200 TaxID=2692211 RepID=UPI001369035B|nr:GEVED domain-containing protein [Flavobacterium sp. Sd200]MXN92716.1 T9SS sorting signal type C domain-containing protein [Flavobacterium sp. Sd200]